MPRDNSGQDISAFIHNLTYADIPKAAQDQAALCVLDLLGVAIGGSQTPLSQIICDHAAAMFGAGNGSAAHMAFDGRKVSPLGATLALGMTIDALDGHDGFNPAKGHVGCGVLPAALAMAECTGLDDGQAFLCDIVIGYELGSRLALALHGTASDYHTSGAWVAVACAAIAARRLGLDQTQTRHALGIAEYHGPRSQMMRVIDHPTMLKDGSGWGAMAGVSAGFLAQSCFTGAPAITMEGPDAAVYWQDLGKHWLITEQYFKPYPVCRWAQAPIEAVLALKAEHGLTSDMVERIEITSFHESIRLATNTPRTTEEAQYSTSFPCAVALVKGTLGPEDVAEAALSNPEIMRLSQGLVMREDDYCNRHFPQQRYAKATLVLKDGRIVTSDFFSPRWTAEEPPSRDELCTKYHDLADKRVGCERAEAIEAAVFGLGVGGGVGGLLGLIRAPLG